MKYLIVLSLILNGVLAAAAIHQRHAAIYAEREEGKLWSVYNYCLEKEAHK